MQRRRRSRGAAGSRPATPVRSTSPGTRRSACPAGWRTGVPSDSCWSAAITPRRRSIAPPRRSSVRATGRDTDVAGHVTRRCLLYPPLAGEGAIDTAVVSSKVVCVDESGSLFCFQSGGSAFFEQPLAEPFNFRIVPLTLAAQEVVHAGLDSFAAEQRHKHSGFEFTLDKDMRHERDAFALDRCLDRHEEVAIARVIAELRRVKAHRFQPERPSLLPSGNLQQRVMTQVCGNTYRLSTH